MDLGEIRGKMKGTRERIKCGFGQRMEKRDV